MRRILCLAALAASFALPLTVLAQTTKVAGAKFANSVQVGGSKLQLDGAGIRYEVVFKVYAAALYLTEKATAPEAVFATPGPRRLQITMLRQIDAN